MSFRNEGSGERQASWRMVLGPCFLAVGSSFGCAEAPLLLGVSLAAECRGSSLAEVASRGAGLWGARLQ